MDAYTMELMATEQRRDRLAEADARRLLRSTRQARDHRPSRPRAGAGRPNLMRRLVRVASGI